MADIVITNGEVVYLRRIKTGDYEHHEAQVTLSFGVAENTENFDGSLRQVASNAVGQVLAMLGNKRAEAGRTAALPAGSVIAGPGVASAVADPVAVEPAAVEPAAVEPVEAKRGPGRPRKLPAALTEVITRAAEILDAADMGEPVVMGDLDPTPAPPIPAARELELADPAAIEEVVVEVAAAPVPVTDGKLLDAVTARNSILKKPTEIRALIAKFAGASVPGVPPRTVRDVPAAVRQAFLLELAALK